ncbi:hypothetical protein MXB_3385 [Myxobolus squamalis]|nr:hypothetical protein MXB_3385 [Myxobolus squamalis]
MKKNENFVSKEGGAIGNVFLRVNDICADVSNSLFKNYKFCTSISDLKNECLLSLSAFALPKSDVISINIHLNPIIFISFEETKRKTQKRYKIHQNVRILLSILFPNDVTCEVSEQKILDDFMSCVISNSFLTNFKHKSPFKSIVAETDVSTIRMSIELYSYQLKTVRWLIRREKNPKKKEISLTFTFFKIPTLDCSEIYYNNYTGYLLKSPLFITPTNFKGGVLADEVGLGKTIEILSLITSHAFVMEQSCMTSSTNVCDRCKRPLVKKLINKIKSLNAMGFSLISICRVCLVQTDSFHSRATFIVCPPTLLDQWLSEMETKVCNPPLNVYVYNGARSEYVHPYFLLEWDVIITTYCILTSEFYHSGLFISDNDGKGLRHKRKYDSFASPLTYVEFWRVVFDESQVAESKLAKVSQMCAYINSLNRWCVTGTPIHRSLNDVEGIFSLINYHPFDGQEFFKKAFYHDLSLGKTDSLVNVLRGIMRRSEKEDVDKEVRNSINIQLAIPGLESISITIDFDPIELHYYLEYNRGNTLKYFKVLGSNYN